MSTYWFCWPTPPLVLDQIPPASAASGTELDARQAARATQQQRSHQAPAPGRSHRQGRELTPCPDARTEPLPSLILPRTYSVRRKWRHRARHIPLRRNAGWQAAGLVAASG